MVAITLLTVSIVAPMALTVQSLESAYYARDEITAENLAQEGLEAVRSVRDGNVLALDEGSLTSPDACSDPSLTPNGIFTCIPIGQAFIIDAHKTTPTLTACGASGSTCSVAEDTLQTDGQLFGYSNASGWTNTNFQRYANATVVTSSSTGIPQEIHITVTIIWQTGSFASRTFSISENLYNWLPLD